MEDQEFIDDIIYRLELQDALDEGDSENIQNKFGSNTNLFSSWEEASFKKTNEHPGRAGHHARVQDQPQLAHAEDQAGEGKDGGHAQV